MATEVLDVFARAFCGGAEAQALRRAVEARQPAPPALLDGLAALAQEEGRRLSAMRSRLALAESRCEGLEADLAAARADLAAGEAALRERMNR